MQRTEGFRFFSAAQFPSCPNFRGQSFSLHCFQKFLICVFLPVLLLWAGMRKEHFHSSRKSPSGQSLAEDSPDLTYLLANKQAEEILLAIRKARANREGAGSQEITGNCFCTHAALLALNLGESRNSPWSYYKQTHVTCLTQGHRDASKHSREEWRAYLWAFIPCPSPWRYCGISCHLIRAFPCHCPRRKIDLSTGEVGNLPVLT